MAAPSVAAPASAQGRNEIDHPKEGCDSAGWTAGGSGAAPFDVQHPRARDAAAPLGCNEINHPLALAPQGCEHMGAGTSLVPQNSPQLEGHEIEMDSWLDHVTATLFSRENNATWPIIQRHLWQTKEKYRVRGSVTPGSRYFFQECSCCGQAVTGRYGRYDAREDHREARQRLSKLVVDEDADGAGKL